MSVLELRHLTHVYSDGTPFRRVALDDISLAVEPGETVALIGATGSGKSTLVQHLNAILKPTSGAVLFRGEDIWSKSFSRTRLRFDVGLVMQYPEYQLFEETVYRDIAFGPRNMGLSEDEVDARVRESMRLVGLPEEKADCSPFDLSGGERRRAAIAGVMAMRPSVIVFDEPTAGLDPRGRDELIGEICRYREACGGTVVVVSHSMEEVAKFADRVFVMDHGRLAMSGTRDDVFSRGAELLNMGLDIPQITKVFLNLKQRGYDVDTSVYTVSRAVEVLEGGCSRG